MEDVLKRMRELRASIGEGGPQKNREKHIARGKMLARECVSSVNKVVAMADKTASLVGSQPLLIPQPHS